MPSADASRYGRPDRPRKILAPGIIAAIVLVAGTLLIGQDAHVIIRYAVAILALISLVFAIEARHWWWVPVLAGIAVLWNPVLPLDVEGAWWMGAHYLAALAFIVAGLTVRAPAPRG